MAKNPGAKGNSPRRGNQASPPQAAPGRPWTAEEMAEARPLPLPDGSGPAAEERASGLPHVGEGQTAPAGRPDGQP